MTQHTDLRVLLSMKTANWQMLKLDFQATSFFRLLFPVTVVVRIEKLAFFFSNIRASHWVRIQNQVDFKWTRNRHHRDAFKSQQPDKSRRKPEKDLHLFLSDFSAFICIHIYIHMRIKIKIHAHIHVFSFSLFPFIVCVSMCYQFRSIFWEKQ